MAKDDDLPDLQKTADLLLDRNLIRTILLDRCTSDASIFTISTTLTWQGKFVRARSLIFALVSLISRR